MLTLSELRILRENAKVHKEVFDAIRKAALPGVSAIEINNIAGKICKKYKVLPAFLGQYNFPGNICISINDVVVHGVPKKDMIFKDGDYIKFDFGVKDTKVGVYTDAAISIIIGKGPHHPLHEKFLATNLEALKRGVAQAHDGNTTGDIGYAIQNCVEKEGFHIVKDLTGHGLGKSLHEKPYIYNYGKKGSGEKLKAGMLIAIEPIIGLTSGKIYDEGIFEIYIEDGSLGSQCEHTVLITKGKPEIII